MATELNNRYQSAYNNSDSSYQEKERKKKKGHIIIDGYNYGNSWSEGDQAKYDLYLKSLEFDNNVDLMNYMNEYNSPAAQAQRMRAAGLNPDLQNISPDSASGQNVQAPSSPTGKGETTSDKVLKYANVAQQFLQLIPEAMNLYSSFQGSLQNLQMNQLEIDSHMQSLGQYDSISAFSPSDFDSYGNLKDSSLHKLQSFTDRRLISLGYDVNKKRNSRSASRRALQYFLGVDNLVNDNHDRLRSGVYAKGSTAASNRSNYLNLLGQYGYGMSDDDFVSILQDYNQVVFEDQKQSAHNRKTMNSNKLGLNLLKKGQQNLKAGNKFAGSIEYILGLLIMNNVLSSFKPRFSRSITSGPQGETSSFDFGL